MSEIRNPNLEPGLEKRTLVIFALMLVAFIITQQWMARNAPQPNKPQPAPAAAPANGSTTAPATTNPPATASAAGAKATSATIRSSKAPAIPVRQATAETETTIENDLYRITFSNRGAQVKSWILKKHEDDFGKPLDMVNARAAEKIGYPLSLFTYDEAMRTRLAGGLYLPSATGTLRAPATVSFEYSDGDIEVHKSFAFDHSLVVNIKTSVTQKGERVSAYPSWPGGLGDQTTPAAYLSSRLDWFHSDTIERQSPSSGLIFKSHVSNGDTVNGPFYWAAVVDNYFAAAFMPDTPANAALVTFHNTIPRDAKETDQEKQKKNTVPVLGAAVGNIKETQSSVRLFVGPKDLDTLQQVHAYAASASAEPAPKGPSLEGVIDFGFFGVIAKPLFKWLNWTHDHWISNWGWCIAFLTVVINVVLFPLRFTGMKSALKQQKIAPEIKQIQHKYRDLKITDPRQAEKQKEMQELMKREGINQMAGCLPMVLQIPILFAFYAMLSAANELRHAHWLWIKDLSSPDPLYILPISIFVTMFLMQRITPMTGMDPQQAKMMQIMMPIMIAGVSWTLPAGLGVYWITGNLVGFITQYIMNNTSMAREVRDHLAKREARKIESKRKR